MTSALSVILSVGHNPVRLKRDELRKVIGILPGHPLYYADQ